MSGAVYPSAGRPARRVPWPNTLSPNHHRGRFSRVHKNTSTALPGYRHARTSRSARRRWTATNETVLDPANRHDSNSLILTPSVNTEQKRWPSASLSGWRLPCRSLNISHSIEHSSDLQDGTRPYEPWRPFGFRMSCPQARRGCLGSSAWRDVVSRRRAIRSLAEAEKVICS